jgi:hypothetical protein
MQAFLCTSIHDYVRPRMRLWLGWGKAGSERSGEKITGTDRSKLSLAEGGMSEEFPFDLLFDTTWCAMISSFWTVICC